MSTQHADIFAALAAPFESGQVKTRSQSGRDLSYITARTAMNRLDNVVGPENWEAEFYSVCDVLFCRITITLPDGRKVSKSDAGGFKTMTTKEHGQTVEDEENTDKTGPSDAFKRAAVLWGIARYLYRDGVPDFARAKEQGPRPSHMAQQPAQAPRSQPAERRQEDRPQAQGGPQEPRQYDGPPRSGKGLFAWSKEMESKHDIGMLKYLNGWSKLKDFPSYMKDWDADQVRQAYEEGCRKLRSVGVNIGGEQQPEPQPVAASVAPYESDGEDIPF